MSPAGHISGGKFFSKITFFTMFIRVLFECSFHLLLPFINNDIYKEMPLSNTSFFSFWSVSFAKYKYIFGWPTITRHQKTTKTEKKNVGKAAEFASDILTGITIDGTSPRTCRKKLLNLIYVLASTEEIRMLVRMTHSVIQQLECTLNYPMCQIFE